MNDQIKVYASFLDILGYWVSYSSVFFLFVILFGWFLFCLNTCVTLSNITVQHEVILQQSFVFFSKPCTLKLLPGPFLMLFIFKITNNMLKEKIYIYIHQ